MRETWVRSLGREDPLEKEMATHSNILAWKIPWTEEPGRVAKSWTRLSNFTSGPRRQKSRLPPEFEPQYMLTVAHEHAK